MKIVLAETQTGILYGLKVLLAEQSGYQLMGVAVNADELFQLIELVSPDLLLLNVRLPGVTNEDLLQLLKQKWPTLNVVVMSARPEHRSRALQAGADGFVCQSEPATKLLATLRALE
ncbi:MAG: response regulator transcription factor [Anaerolineales bacterium]|nr:response regulator transcription factor [Anaerolineales bacterium]